MIPEQRFRLRWPWVFGRPVGIDAFFECGLLEPVKGLFFFSGERVLAGQVVPAVCPSLDRMVQELDGLEILLVVIKLPGHRGERVGRNRFQVGPLKFRRGFWWRPEGEWRRWLCRLAGLILRGG
jgi:hypothetical protein